MPTNINYDARTAGLPFTRVASIDVQYSDPKNGSVRLQERVAIPTTTGDVLPLREGRTLNMDINPDMLLATFPTVNLDTGIVTGNTMTGRQILMGLMALGRHLQLAEDAK